MASHITSTLLSLALAATSVSAHAFFHEATINGVSQGQLFGVRAPASNNPIQDPTSSAITCNSPLYSPVSTGVIEVAPGDTFGMQWNHNIGGPTAGDADDPIAASHKGPIMVYMAKVSDASSADGSGLDWFKVAEEGLDTSTGKWGVDTLLANAGLWSFAMPPLAPGDYLLRGELLALHSAGSTGGAQFYMSCAGVRVTGSGTCAPSDTVSFPSAYSASDPGILISIYGNTGAPDNGGKDYTAPGPGVVECDGSGSGSGSVELTSSVTTAKNVASSSVSSSVATGTLVETSTVASSVVSSAASSMASIPEYTVSAPAYTPIAGTSAPAAPVPTTMATLTGSAPASSMNGTAPVGSQGSGSRSWSWSWSRPPHTKGNGHGSGSGSASASAPAASSSAPASMSMSISMSMSAGQSISITASVTETGIAVPSTSTAVEATATATRTGPAATSTATATGYPMTGPEGKKFLCYEVAE